MSSKNLEIFAIQERALAARKASKRIVNASSGMLFREDRSLCTFPIVNEALSRDVADYLRYTDPLGPKEFGDAVFSWTFGDRADEVRGLGNVGVATTPGGTGALAMLFRYYGDHEGGLVLPDLCWSNYFSIASVAGVKQYIFHRMDAENRYDFAALSSVLDHALENHEKVLLLLNDPCQNPSGYCFSKEEYKRLFALLNCYKGRVDLCLDLAYFDYSPKGFIFPDVFCALKRSFDVHIIFSASKSFGCYGLRLGALVSILFGEYPHKEFYRYARSSYSCPNHAGIGPLGSVMKDEALKAKMREAIAVENKRLFAIGSRVCAALTKKGYRPIPYSGGFFLVFPREHARDFCERIEDLGFYFTPIGDEYIRLAVSSMNLEDVRMVEEEFPFAE